MPGVKKLAPVLLIVTSCSTSTDVNLAGNAVDPVGTIAPEIDSLEATSYYNNYDYEEPHTRENDDDSDAIIVTGSLLSGGITSSYGLKVFFATNRQSILDSAGDLTFSSKRGPLNYGVALVNVPRGTHVAGRVERPRWWRLEYESSPDAHFLINHAKKIDYSAWMNELRFAFKKGGRRSALLFVHGYNVGFSEAIMRTAQIAWDVQFPGAPIVFSWPSQGRLVGYPADEASAEFALHDFKRLLDHLVSSQHVDDVFIVAHSMGNRIVTRALTDDPSKLALYRSKIRDVILAAPDIDADVFRTQISPRLPRSTQRVTLYASSDDTALAASKKFHGGVARAGDGGSNLLVSPLIDTIDASGLSSDWLGHSYVSNSPRILRDIRALIETDLAPTARGHRFRRRAGSGYWVVRH